MTLGGIPAPAWSPDGTRIAFESDRGIEVMDADGGNLRLLTVGLGWAASPAWSPDGTQIVFSSSRDGDYDIYVMDADGGNVRQLTDGPGWDADPAWSPDGSRIAFVNDHDGDSIFHYRGDIYVMNADGSNVQQLTDTPGMDDDPTWSVTAPLVEPGRVTEPSRPFVLDGNSAWAIGIGGAVFVWLLWAARESHQARCRRKALRKKLVALRDEAEPLRQKIIDAPNDFDPYGDYRLWVGRINREMEAVSLEAMRTERRLSPSPLAPMPDEPHDGFEFGYYVALLTQYIEKL